MPSKTPGREALDEQREIARSLTSKLIDVDSATAEGPVAPDSQLVQEALEIECKQLKGVKSWNVLRKLHWFAYGLDLGEVPIVLRGDNPRMVAANLGAELVARIHEAVNATAVPISLMDRTTLTIEKIQQAQRYYEAAQYLSAHFAGAANVKYGSAFFGNFDEVIRLYWQQLKAGRFGDKMKAGLNPVMWSAILIGSLANTPIESFTLEKGHVSEVRATGHGAGVGNIAFGTAIAYGLGTLALGMGGLSIGSVAALLGATIAVGASVGGPIAATLLQLKKGQHKPAHVLVHSMQYLVLGLALKNGYIEEDADLLAIQNKISVLGYLWGDKTEHEGTIPAEEESHLDPVFKTLVGNASAFFRKRYPDPAKAESMSTRFADYVHSIAVAMYGEFPDLFKSAPEKA